MSEAKPIAGQWAVVKSPYSWGLYRVVSVTAKQFKGVDPVWGKRENTVQLYNCVYCSDEVSARKLRDQLISSEAQFNEERRKAGERRIKRDAELIEAAKGGAS